MPVELLPDIALQAFSGSISDVLNTLGELSIWIGAFAGGAFGAAVGALPAFVITGFLVVAGAAAGVLGVEAQTTGLVGIGFGHVFGPHISFAGGAAAAAYAAKRGYMDSGFDYHNAKDIGFALGNRPDVLAVGGVFGLLGIGVEQFSRQMAVPVDPIPVAICVSAIAHRLVFGYSVIGKVRGSNLLDMSPFEREETIGAAADGGEVATDGGTTENGGTPRSEWMTTEPWLPHQYKWGQVAAIGLVAGLASGYIAFRTGSPFLAFGVSAASLLFLNLGVANIPVTHHMTLAGSTVYLAVTAPGDAALAGLGVAPALLIAGVLGLIAAVLGEVTQRIFYAHARTHMDPPAMAIVIWTVALGILHIAGIIPTGVWIPGTV